MPRKARCTTPPTRTIRCAIYTRKSTEEGLEQAFNSLDAQREAAEAYIASQRHQGWTVLPERFDDAGYTGANMDRPALKRLLQAVESGGVDCVVVYKVDRLSRSLLNFAQIMETLEKRGATFVSITQHFNTTVSIGRLTLNILLSFAQFERELIGERTRDKMWAAKRKGKWVGGIPPLGYDVAPEGGRLVLNAVEAELVREIYSLALDGESVIEVVEELNRRDRKTKEWTSRQGKPHGGLPFSKNAVLQILRNRTYSGEIQFRGETYAGEHPAIVDGRVQRAVQEKLLASRSRGAQAKSSSAAPLSGLLYCAACDARMLPTHSVKAGRRYRYYVCSTAQQRGWSSCPTKSVNAASIEQAVTEKLRAIAPGGGSNSGGTVRRMVQRITYDRERRVACVRLKEQFGGEIEVAVARFGQARNVGRAPRIARLLALAIRCEELVRTGVVDDYTDLARLGIVTRPRMTQIMNLLNLAPQIQEEILCLPETHGGRDCLNEHSVRRIPAILDWSVQLDAWNRLKAERACRGTAS